MRRYLDYKHLDCRFEGSHESQTVQDKNTTVKRIVERMASGVINPEDLKISNMTYSDFGLPKGLDSFERMDMARANASVIKDMEEKLKTPPPAPAPAPDPAPDPA